MESKAASKWYQKKRYWISGILFLTLFVLYCSGDDTKNELQNSNTPSQGQFNSYQTSEFDVLPKEVTEYTKPLPKVQAYGT